MIVTTVERDNSGAVDVLNSRGIHVPVINGLPNAGWVVRDRAGAVVGAVVAVPSTDGEDSELHADGGWTVPSAKRIMRAIFNDFGHYRVSASCLASNVRNIRILQRMGFRIEGEKRCFPENRIILGMLKSECRFLRS
jgi:RimJ/RimL family protein N-acetyltransferase